MGRRQTPFVGEFTIRHPALPHGFMLMEAGLREAMLEVGLIEEDRSSPGHFTLTPMGLAIWQCGRDAREKMKGGSTSEPG